MPARKSILLRIDVREAGRLSRCKHNRNHAIAKGELRFVVKEPGPGTPEHGYCAVCATQMVADAEEKLASLRASLD